MSFSMAGAHGLTRPFIQPVQDGTLSCFSISSFCTKGRDMEWQCIAVLLLSQQWWWSALNPRLSDTVRDGVCVYVCVWQRGDDYLMCRLILWSVLWFLWSFLHLANIQLAGWFLWIYNIIIHILGLLVTAGFRLRHFPFSISNVQLLLQLLSDFCLITATELRLL